MKIIIPILFMNMTVVMMIGKRGDDEDEDISLYRL